MLMAWPQGLIFPVYHRTGAVSRDKVASAAP